MGDKTLLPNGEGKELIFKMCFTSPPTWENHIAFLEDYNQNMDRVIKSNFY